MSERYVVVSEWAESDLPLITINPIYHVVAEDTKTGGTAEGTGWSHEEALADAITQLGGEG